MRKGVIVLIVISVLLIACQSLSQKDAEGIALRFIDDNVKFFAQGKNDSTIIEKVNPPIASSYREGKLWVVLVHVSSELNGTEKKNDLIVKVDKNGEIVEFNGKKLG